MKRLRAGVIGCGMVAHVGHLPFLAKSPKCRITAIADPEPRNLHRTRKKYRVPNTFEDPKQLLESGLTDAVVVCSPNWTHAEQVVLAAERGLPILCEKPLATNLEDCDRMIRDCGKAGVLLHVAFQKRFHPAFQKAREIIDRGELGQVYQISLFWNHSIPDLDAPWLRIPMRFLEKTGIDLQKKWGAWRLTDPRSGGGDFMDHGPHYLDLFRFLPGPYDLISGEMKRVFPSRVHEDHALCTVRFASGALGHIERSQNVVSRPYGREKGAIHGSRGSLYFEVPHEYTPWVMHGSIVIGFEMPFSTGGYGSIPMERPPINARRTFSLREPSGTTRIGQGSRRPGLQRAKTGGLPWNPCSRPTSRASRNARFHSPSLPTTGSVRGRWHPSPLPSCEKRYPV